MESFVRQIADLIDSTGLPENEVCVVFPNRRAGLFLKKELIPVSKPRWLPGIMSIEDFVYNFSGLHEPQPNQLLAILYKIYKEVVKEPVTFDNYLGFGAEVLRDFEEVDQYLVNPQNVFDYVKQAREIDIWKPGEKLTDFEKNYINFYNSLYDQYDQLKERCLLRGLGWQGLATRLLAEDTAKLISKVHWKKIIFAGFNALTPAQITFIRFLIKEGLAELMFDADSYYLDNPVAEAGHFLRKYRNDKSLGDFHQVSDNFTSQDKKIYTCGITGKTGQARAAGNILSQIPVEEHHQTALVLADESLLLPVLNSLPGSLAKFNVTMGFPLNQTPLYQLIDSVFNLHVNSSPQVSENPSFYYADVINTLSNPYLRKIKNFDFADYTIRLIKKNNYSYISYHEVINLTGHNHELIDIIFTGCLSPQDLLHKIVRLLVTLKKELTENDNENYSESEYLSEILYSLHKLVTDLTECLNEEQIEIGTLQTLYSFFRETASQTKIPFYGEPLEGIQIMGMLETRVLDFKNVILLSVNEDTLPAAKINRSFIPFDIRVHYGLPTHAERQAIFAYHFYHLLQRSKNAWLLYNADEDSFGGGEKSRFISQLEWELPSKGISITPLELIESSSSTEIYPIIIHKDEYVISKLKEKAVKGFSFSSLRLFINCSLSFYFTYILNLKEPDEVEEEISSRTMGTVLHEVLEDLYSPFIGSFPTEDVLRDAIGRAESLIFEKTAKTFPALRLNSGKNLLFIKVAETWLKRFLTSELKELTARTAPTLLGIEVPVEKKIRLTVDPELEIRLYGKIDRLDLKDGIIRVLDYKTGKVDDRDITANSVQDLFSPDKSTDKQLQLLLYKAILETGDFSDGNPVEPGIISFRALNKGVMNLKSNIPIEDFQSGLTDLLAEIFNTEINFSQTDSKHCKFCNFKQICHRN